MMIFKGIVESGSITNAAERLSLSKSAVSQQLKLLEEAIGAPLIYRNTRRQSLTPIGREFYHYCQEISNLSDDAWKKAKATQETIRGKLTVTSSFGLMDSIVAPALCKLFKEYPEIKLNFICDDKHLDLIEHGIDLAIRVGKSRDSNYTQQRLGSFKDILYKAKGSNFSLQDHVYISNSWEKKEEKYILTHKLSQHTLNVKFKEFHRTNTLTETVRLIESDFGVGIVPELFDISKVDIEELCPEYSLPDVNVFALHNCGSKASATIKLAKEAIVSFLDSKS